MATNSGPVVRLTRVLDTPRGFWLASLGSHRDAPCGTGDTVPEALESLALRLRRAALSALDLVLEDVAQGQSFEWMVDRWQANETEKG